MLKICITKNWNKKDFDRDKVFYRTAFWQEFSNSCGKEIESWAITLLSNTFIEIFSKYGKSCTFDAFAEKIKGEGEEQQDEYKLLKFTLSSNSDIMDRLAPK
jgi:hypothetical protein